MSGAAARDLRLDFRLAERERDDTWLRGEASRVIAEVVGGLGSDRIRSVVVGGSLARGEGAVLWKENERIEVLADLDLYVVASKDAFVDSLCDAGAALARRLADGELPADVGVTTTRTLATLPATIANLSLAAEGRVVWGDGDVLRAARRVDPREIPRSDALNLMLNRAAEELSALRAAARDPESARAARNVFRRGAKTVADLGLAVLMMRGDHTTTYRGRGKRVASALASDPTLRAAMPAGFARSVEEACRWKTAPVWEDLAGLLPETAGYAEAARRALVERAAAMRGALRWYAGAGVDLIGDLARAEPLLRSVRAWARYARGSARAARCAAARLAAGHARPAPRLGAQLAALVLFLAWSDEDRRDACRAALRLAPGAPRDAGGEAVVDAVLESWCREVLGRGKA
jgi:hypothetical protein